MDETIKVKKAEVLLAVLLLLYLTSVLSLHDLLSFQTSHHCDAAWRALPTHWPETNPAVMARI